MNGAVDPVVAAIMRAQSDAERVWGDVDNLWPPNPATRAQIRSAVSLLEGAVQALYNAVCTERDAIEAIETREASDAARQSEPFAATVWPS